MKLRYKGEGAYSNGPLNVAFAPGEEKEVSEEFARHALGNLPDFFEAVGGSQSATPEAGTSTAGDDEPRAKAFSEPPRAKPAKGKTK